jgi:hypothetical protein
MRISIDTATDSHDHIRKVIDLLRQMIGESHSSSAPSSSSNVFEPQGASPFAGIFGDSAPAAPAAPAPESPPAAPADPSQPQVVDLWGNPKKPDDQEFPVEVY